MPTGLPFHPVLVHFPIALYALELWLLLLWVWKNDTAFRRFALITFKLGYFSMLASVATGIIDHGGLQRLEGPVAVHFYLALGVAAVYTARAVGWAVRGTESPRDRFFQIAGAIAGNLMMFGAAYAGGRLVY